MAYAVNVITDIDQIPAELAAFASARGWTVVGTTITRPGGGLSFEITTAKYLPADPPVSKQQLIITDTATPTQRAWTSLPQLDGTDLDNPVILTPTKIHMFGNDTPYDPAPYIAFVIECGYNHYRHGYIGNMVKYGSYTGGEVISLNYFSQGFIGPDGSITFDSLDHRYGFSARNNAGAGTGPVGLDSGGANIVHVDNINTWRKFDGPTTPIALNDLLGDELFGGNQDTVNSGLVRRGFSDFAGAGVLVTPLLFCSNGADGVDYRIRPLGFPAGVRLINMQDISPGDQIAVGTRQWRCFPEFQKNDATTVYRGGAGTSTGFWWEDETSYLVGLAYPETDS